MMYSLVSVVVLLMSAVIFLMFEANLRGAYAESVAKNTCKASVRAHAALKLRYADFSGEIKCPTVKLNIDDNNENAAKKKIADAMFDCWDQFGRGSLELFGDKSIYCAICHRITFDKELKINDFTKYLESEKAPGQEIRYLQFLTTEKTENVDFLKESENRKIEDTIDASKNKEYAVIFTYIKGRENLKYYAEKAQFYLPGFGLGGGALTLGGALAFGKLGTGLIGIVISGFLVPVATTLLVAGTATVVIGYFYNVPFEHIALVSFISYNADSLQQLNCKEVPVK